jgi:hypothetical protein
VSKFLQNLLVQISKSLVNSKKNLIFNPKFLFPIHFSLSAQLALSAHLAFGPASPAGLPSPAGRSLPHRPIWPVCRWRLRRNTFFFSVCTLRAGRVLSHLSLSSVPRLLAPSPTLRWPTPAAPRPATPRHLAPCLEWLPRSLTHPAIRNPSLTIPLTSPSSMALKTFNATVTSSATPPRHSPGPYKR